MQRAAPLLIAAALLAALPPQAAAQSGLRVGSRAVDNAVQAVRGQESEVRIALTPVGGQGFTYVPSGWSGTGFRLPAMAGTPTRYGLSAETGASLDVQVDRWTVSSTVRQGLSPMRQDGSRLDFGASYGMPFATRHELVVSGGLGFAAGAAGLAPTAGQEVASNETLLPYSSATGLRDVGLRLSWRYSLDRNLYVNTSVGVDRLFADPTGFGGAYDRNVNSVGAVFGYRFY